MNITSDLMRLIPRSVPVVIVMLPSNLRRFPCAFEASMPVATARARETRRPRVTWVLPVLAPNCRPVAAPFTVTELAVTVALELTIDRPVSVALVTLTAPSATVPPTVFGTMPLADSGVKTCRRC